MIDCSIIIIETGFHLKMSSFFGENPVSNFPFWGNFTFFDFTLADFFHDEIPMRYIIVDRKFKKAVPFFTSRGKNEFTQIICPENDLPDFIAFLQQIQTGNLLIVVLSSVALVNPANIVDKIRKTDNKSIQFAVNEIPLPVFFVRKSELIEWYNEETKNRDIAQTNSGSFLNEVVPSRIDSIVNIEGNIFFYNSLMQLYEGNSWLLKNTKNRIFAEFLSKSAKNIPDSKGSFISEKGYARNSFLSSGVEIEGYVENSVIFPDVTVKKNSKVINSVIMNNNCIGTNVLIQNSMILPHYEERTNNAVNIGDNAIIGGKSSISRNKEFPDQIFNGITVIGMNSTIPKGFAVEEAAFLGSYISVTDLKELKFLKKGVSLYKKTEI